MKATDLRIGNLIRDGHEIETVTSDHIKCAESGRCEYDPIPLTEEWLLKFGIIWDGDIKILKGYLNNYVDGNGETRLKYVHQLQNLFHALTGEELKLEG